jgi:hypothetical protein
MITPDPTPTPIVGPGRTLDVGLDQPFSLRAGQTAVVAAEDLSLTLRSLSDDSGCFTPDDCSIMLGEGTLALQASEERLLLDFSASLRPDEPFTTEFAGYVIALVHVEAIEGGEPAATFVVSSQQPAVVEVPAPRAAKRCPSFSRFDAAALLQMEVAKQPVANLVFAPLAADAPAPLGYCGYAAEEENLEIPADTLSGALFDEPLDPALPYLASAVGSPYAAVADRLRADEVEQLLHLLALVSRGKGPDLVAQMMLEAQLAAGESDALLPTLYETAQANPDAQVTWLDETRRDALWLALPANGGHFVAAIQQVGDEFVVVAALVGPDVAAEDTKGYALTFLSRFSR